MSIRPEGLKQAVPKVSAVLSTHNDGQPFASLVAFVFSNGLPCVTGIPDATTPVQIGDLLTVDGYLGVVTVGSGEI
jgi:pyruvate,water dikinase